MESSGSKKRGRPRKIIEGDDDVRVILEDESGGSTDSNLPFLGLKKGALWSQILMADQSPHKIIAPVQIQEDLQMVDAMLESDTSKANNPWKLLFDPKEAGKERDPDHYELLSLPRQELVSYA